MHWNPKILQTFSGRSGCVNTNVQVRLSLSAGKSRCEEILAIQRCGYLLEAVQYPEYL